VNQLGQGIATGAIAPIYQGMPAALQAEANIGEQERQIGQAGLQAQQSQYFTQPMAQQSQAANALFQAAGMGPGGMDVSTTLGLLGTLSAIGGAPGGK
jgi:hypothetical protein